MSSPHPCNSLNHCHSGLQGHTRLAITDQAFLIKPVKWPITIKWKQVVFIVLRLDLISHQPHAAAAAAARFVLLSLPVNALSPSITFAHPHLRLPFLLQTQWKWSTRRPSVRWLCSRSSGTWSPPPVIRSTSRLTPPTGPANLRTAPLPALMGRVSSRHDLHEVQDLFQQRRLEEILLCVLHASFEKRNQCIFQCLFIGIILAPMHILLDRLARSGIYRHF